VILLATQLPCVAIWRVLWRQAREQVSPFFAFVPDIRKINYPSNAIESLPIESGALWLPWDDPACASRKPSLIFRRTGCAAGLGPMF
jgi:hypothetical protein